MGSKPGGPEVPRDRSPVAELAEASDSKYKRVQLYCAFDWLKHRKCPVAKLNKKFGGPEAPWDRSPVAEFIEANLYKNLRSIALNSLKNLIQQKQNQL